MSIGRFAAIGLIFAVVSVGWWVLAATVQLRTEELDDSLSAEMASLWGPKVLAQGSPYWAAADAGGEGRALPAAGKVTADLRHEHRYKGLLWYSTFEVDFAGEYRVGAVPGAPGGAPGGGAPGAFVFPLPAGAATYHALSVAVDGNEVPVAPGDIASGRLSVPLGRDAEHTVAVRYVTGGQDTWLYCPGEVPAASERGDGAVIPPAGRLNELRDFSLTVTTDFAQIDYPRGTLSPKQRAAPTPAGMRAIWEYPRLITSQSIGIAMPRRPNAGPIVARMSFFAPVSLLFFLTVLFAVVVLKGLRLHAMHYLFIAAGFFAFHILLSYLADVMDLHAAFWASAAVSAFLVVTYMRLVAGVRFALAYTGLAQLVYLVGFSYAFFWVGRTGLTITIAAVVTLFVLMQATGKVNWHEFFRRPERPRTVLPPMSPPPMQPPAGG